MVDILDQIADHIEALCDPHHHAEPRWEWDHNRHRKQIAPHRTTVPGLIQQLRDLTGELAAMADSGTRTIPNSTPPGAFDAVSLLASIGFGAAWRCHHLGMEDRGQPEANLRAVVGALAGIDHDTRHQIRNELGSWRRQAEVITGWRTPAIELPAPCPVVDCGARGALLARADGDHAEAWCTSCGTKWSGDTRPSIDILARHVADYREHADRANADARAQAVAERRATEWRHAVA